MTKPAEFIGLQNFKNESPRIPYEKYLTRYMEVLVSLATEPDKREVDLLSSTERDF